MSKLNLVRPQGSKLVLGGKEYDVVFDFNAFAELEEAFGSVQNAFEALQNPKMMDILKIVHAGLASSEEEVSTKELGKYLSPTNLGDVMLVINDALKVALPQEEAKTSTTKN